MHPIEKALGYTFRDPDHLTRALTHRSHSAKHNERLEYLGDALLETISSIWIYNNRPAVPEGDLTRLRATIVKEPRRTPAPWLRRTQNRRRTARLHPCGRRRSAHRRRVP